jgi:quercetin dioxygenase-like cupin family protein
MPVVTENSDRVTTTPNASMTPLATPSLGSRELSTWRVQMKAGADGPVHVIDREQIWLPIAGTFDITIDGEVKRVGPGQVAIVPAGATRQIRAGEAVEALVCMAIGGMARVPGSDAPVPLPWAE